MRRTPPPEFNLATYNLQIFAPKSKVFSSLGGPGRWMEEDKRVLSNLPAMLEAVEEDLTKLLPPGYSAVIKEWNDE